MAVTPADIVAQMRQTLAVTEPDLDTTVGTPVRKVLDAVGEVIAEAYVDQYLLNYQYDPDTKSGTDLDDYVAQFGFTRLPAKRATGDVTFERTSAATTDIIIPIGTQMATSGAVPVVLATLVPAVLVAGDTSITVPAQALVGGSVGNVAAGAITTWITPTEGITSVSNLASFSGGADAESDTQLRDRFKRTIFRNMAGTEDMFRAVALDNEAVTQVNVLGSSKRYREQVEVVGRTATSSIQDAFYVYPDSSVVGESIDSDDVLTRDVHYTFTNSNPPTIASLDETAMPDGVYEMEFEYVPVSSRNDPANNITNRVDIYVNGEAATEATQTAVFRHARTFNNTDDDPLNATNFERLDGTAPQVGNFFVALAFAPVTDPSTTDSLIIDGVTYEEGDDFFLVNDITDRGGTPSSLSGIEFKSIANGLNEVLPPDLTTFPVTYVFNRVPLDVELALREWRLITTDVKVHQARPMRLRIHLAIIFAPNYGEAIARPVIEQRLTEHIASIGFNGVVQVSDLIDVIHGIQGVDSVRLLSSDDNNTDFAIQRVNALGAVQETYSSVVAGQVKRAIDVVFADNELPVFHSVIIRTKAQNTFGPV